VSTSLLRGLAVLEMLAAEPLGVSEIARRLGVDKAGVSRTMAGLAEEGWVARTGGRYVLGDRALRLAAGPERQAFLDRADALVAELSARTGLSAAAVQLAGTGAQPLAARESPAAAGFLHAEEPYDYLWGTAGGVAVLAQLADEALDPHLADDPWPALPGVAAPSSADEVRGLVAEVRLGEPAYERGWTIPGVACLALPWLDPAAGAPAAVLVLGPEDEVVLRHADLLAALREAVVVPG
jgi:DNA-binding IclR family transcriptional regulator